jgi:hypothetical protein
MLKPVIASCDLPMNEAVTFRAVLVAMDGQLTLVELKQSQHGDSRSPIGNEEEQWRPTIFRPCYRFEGQFEHFINVCLQDRGIGCAEPRKHIGASTQRAFARLAADRRLRFSGLSSYLARSMPLFRKLTHFGRIAVVADQACVRIGTRIESAVLPFISNRTFAPNQRDDALAWVEGSARSDVQNAGSRLGAKLHRQHCLGRSWQRRLTGPFNEPACAAPISSAPQTIAPRFPLRDTRSIDRASEVRCRMRR